MASRKTLAYLFFVCVLLATYAIYIQGVSGSLYYDDFRPLSGLSSIDGAQSMLVYVLGEISGPLGRPVSMISFLVNQHDWPNNIESILHFNIVLHCINALLVFILCDLLVKLSREDSKCPEWLALAAAALWMLSPLLISTSLIAVQRMASLSAFFVLSGLISYLLCFFLSERKPKRCLALQAGAIGFFTLLAMLSKENGVLLPVFALVIEVTLIQSVTSASKFRNLRVVAFGLCLFAILGFLAFRLMGADESYLHRSFSLAERIMTQPVILFDYLRLAFIPDIFSYSPFHDNYQYYTSFLQWPVALAMLALVVLFGLAIMLRKKNSLFSFAVLWFLAAHLLESSVINLELFFEHRNYVALIGPCLAMAVALSSVPSRYRKVSCIIFVLYLGLLGFSSYQVASIWGDQPVAGKIWFDHSKGSARAAEHYAIQLLEAGESEKAYLVLQQQAEQCLECVGSQAQAMQLACRFDDQDKVDLYNKRITQSREYSRSVDTAPSSLAAIIKDVVADDCSQITLEQLKRLNLAILPYKQGGGRLAVLVNLHQIALAENDTAANIYYLQQAWHVERDGAIGQILVGNLLKVGKLKEAKLFVDNKMCASLPILPTLQKKELARCELASRWVSEAMEEHQDKPE